jgi:hypothetical protein
MLSNNRKISLLFVMTLLPVVLVMGQDRELVDLGSITDSVYENRYFGFSLRLPEGWFVQNRAGLERIQETGKDLLSGDDKSLKSLFEAGEKSSFNLLGIHQHPPGAPVDFNPTLLCVAEKTEQFPGIAKGADYLFHAKRTLQIGAVDAKFPKDVYSMEIGGKSFDTLDIELRFGPATVKEKMLATLIKDYALAFIIVYDTNDHYNTLLDILNTVRFASSNSP